MVIPRTVESANKSMSFCEALTKYGVGRSLGQFICFINACSISTLVTSSRLAYQFIRPSNPMEMCERMNAPSGISGWSAPQVPNLTTFKVVCSGFTSRVAKSILAKASSSVITMSMLSVPIPVESTVMRELL